MKPVMIRYYSPDRDVPNGYSFLSEAQAVANDRSGFHVNATSGWKSENGDGFQSQELWMSVPDETSLEEIASFKSDMESSAREQGAYEPHDGPSAFFIAAAMFV
jgi:hypothetical protein